MADLSATILLALRLFMAVALYAFLGWSLLVLWRDLKNQAQTIGNRKVPALDVKYLGGGLSEELRFTSPEVVIGRHPRCEWVLANDTVSSRHARMVYHHDQWWLEDLGSRNGTFLNGATLTAPAVLANRDQVRCGKVNFSIAMEDGLDRGIERCQPKNGSHAIWRTQLSDNSGHAGRPTNCLPIPARDRSQHPATSRELSRQYLCTEISRRSLCSCSQRMWFPARGFCARQRRHSRSAF